MNKEKKRAAEIEELEKANRWIPVSEKLPEEGKYDVYDGRNKWEEMFTKLDSGRMGWLRCNLTITHYRPITLPESKE